MERDRRARREVLTRIRIEQTDFAPIVLGALLPRSTKGEGNM